MELDLTWSFTKKRYRFNICNASVYFFDSITITMIEALYLDVLGLCGGLLYEHCHPSARKTYYSTHRYQR